MATTTQARNEWNETTSIRMVHGDSRHGIGYVHDEPVICSGGDFTPGPHPGEKWAWGDGSGRYWAVQKGHNGRGIWVEIGAITADGGWSLL